MLLYIVELDCFKMKLYLLFQTFYLVISSCSQLVHCRKKGTVINDMLLKIVVDCSFIEIIQLPAPLMDHDRATVIDGEYIVVFKQDAQDDESKS